MEVIIVLDVIAVCQHRVEGITARTVTLFDDVRCVPATGLSLNPVRC